jgi:hypothetical protein
VASTSWNEKSKVLKFVELTCLYPSLHGATWRMWGVGAECLWATWLGEALGQHDRQQEYVRVGCETGVALLHDNNSSLGLHLRGNNSSLGHPVVHHMHNGVSLPAGYTTMVRKLRRVGWRDTSNQPDERGGQEHQPGGKNIVSELVEAVRCAKSLG